MKNLSLAKRIEAYLQRQNRWINGGEIERLAESVGYKASNASRRCREMESGKDSAGNEIPITLERKEMNGSVWYRHLQGEQKVEAPKPKIVFREINGLEVAVMV